MVEWLCASLNVLIINDHLLLNLCNFLALKMWKIYVIFANIYIMLHKLCKFISMLLILLCILLQPVIFNSSLICTYSLQYFNGLFKIFIMIYIYECNCIGHALLNVYFAYVNNTNQFLCWESYLSLNINLVNKWITNLFFIYLLLYLYYTCEQFTSRCQETSMVYKPLK
jgi:hypothetical protein